MDNKNVEVTYDVTLDVTLNKNANKKNINGKVSIDVNIDDNIDDNKVFNSNTINIVWFRRDLRLEDNESVYLATSNQNPTLFIFCVDPWFYSNNMVGDKRVNFLFESLVDLDNELQKLGSNLTILEGNTIESFSELITTLNKFNIQAQLYFNTDVQVQYGIDRDNAIRSLWSAKNCSYIESLASFMIKVKDKSDMSNWGRKYYNYQQSPLHPHPRIITEENFQSGIQVKPLVNSFDIKQLQLENIQTPLDLLNRFKSKNNINSRIYQGGSTNAHIIVNDFIKHRSVGYNWRQSRPWQAQQGGVSQLSPHITFGTISPRQVYQLSRDSRQKTDRKHAFALKSFEERLRWRDHFFNKLLLDPSIAWKNHYHEYDSVYNLDELDEEKNQYFIHWKNGTTGFPLIDASMRQLNRDGYMNFRMRAMNATFLTINCGISWHHGAEYFMTQLVDGDIAINHWQWQMQAGITNPFSTTFRIYNPNSNISEKDPTLEYIHYWCPEYNSCKSPLEVIECSKPMLDFKSTRSTNGKIISNIRETVRNRLAIKYNITLPLKQTKSRPKSKTKTTPNDKKLIDETSIDLFI